MKPDVMRRRNNSCKMWWCEIFIPLQTQSSGIEAYHLTGSARPWAVACPRWLGYVLCSSHDITYSLSFHVWKLTVAELRVWLGTSRRTLLAQNSKSAFDQYCELKDCRNIPLSFAYSPPWSGSFCSKGVISVSIFWTLTVHTKWLGLTAHLVQSEA